MKKQIIYVGSYKWRELSSQWMDTDMQMSFKEYRNLNGFQTDEDKRDEN